MLSKTSQPTVSIISNSVFSKIMNCKVNVASVTKGGLASTAIKEFAFPIGRKRKGVGVFMESVLALTLAFVKKVGQEILTEISAISEFVQPALTVGVLGRMNAIAFMDGKVPTALLG